MAKDYYKILGVPKSASKEEIKKVYKKLALKYHPDRAPENKKKEYEEEFKKISEAAAVLSDEKKRQQYDQFGDPDAFKQASGFEGFQGFDFSDLMSKFRFGTFGDFDDLFEQLFTGGAPHRSSRRRGQDLQYEIEITLEEAYHGTEKTLTLNKLEPCPACQGRGGKNFQTCSQCGGSGYFKKTSRTPFGFFQQTSPCPYCRGEGEVSNQACSDCHGEGLIRRKKQIEITIPPGVESGTHLRVKGEGEVGEYNGPPGNLYLLIHLQPHKLFKKINHDFHLTLPISFTQACLGDEIEVPTLSNPVKLKIPPSTSSETLFRLKDKGFPYLNSPGFGDLLVKVTIQVPSKLTKKQKELLEQFQEEKPSKNFFKSFFS